MRASLVFLFLTTIGCASAAPTDTRRLEVEQFIVAVRACVPTWFITAPTLENESFATVLDAVATDDTGSRLLAPFHCVVDAGSDCARVRECYGLRSSATSGPCMGAPPRCDGDTLLLCIPALDPSPTQVGLVDCTVEGLSCLEATVSGLGTARCGTALCRSPAAGCDGNALVVCDGTFETRETAPAGMTCREVGGSAEFVGAGAPCEDSRCIGNVAHLCDFATSREWSLLDCTALGQRCTDMGFVHCVIESPQCSSSTEPFCVSPSIVQYCGTDGRHRGYDCVAHGFAGCEERFVPERGLVMAGCAPVGPRF